MSALAKCPRHRCGMTLCETFDALGRMHLICPGCARNQRGLCRDCPQRLADPHGMRCARCARVRRYRLQLVAHWRSKGLDEATITRRVLDCCEQCARRIPDRKPKQRFCADCADARDRAAKYRSNRKHASYYRERTRAFRAAHPERVRAYQRKGYQKHRLERLAKQRERDARNRERILARKRAWYQRNRERILADVRETRAYLRRVQANAARRAEQRGAA